MTGYCNGMKDEMERERKLIEEIQSALPEFVQACKAKDGDFVLMHQDVFAPKLGDYELLLLGKAIKYAGLMGKEVGIIPSPRLLPEGRPLFRDRDPLPGRN
jgi:hypothetical protein